MIVFITGGASGLGEAITRRLALNPDLKIYFTFCKALEQAKFLEKEFNNTSSIKCDFRDQQELKSLIEKIKEMNIDVLIHNAYAGEFLKTHFQKISPEEFSKDFLENIMPVIEITQEAIINMRRNKRGKIITLLTSALHEVPPIGSAVYIANKAYVEKLTKVWAHENEKYNISSISISPSFMLSRLTRNIDERVVEQIRENNPHKRLLKFEEVAEVVYSLVQRQEYMKTADIILNPGKT